MGKYLMILMPQSFKPDTIEANYMLMNGIKGKKTEEINQFRWREMTA
jgi:hypothetical protein